MSTLRRSERKIVSILTGRNGTTLVIKRGPTFEVLLAENPLDDGFDASPAIVDNEIYLRGRKYLYCIAQN